MEKEEKSYQTRAWGLLLSGLILLFFSPALTKTFIFRDSFNLFYPYKAFVAQCLRGFSVSTWNPFETMGSSFIGELSPGWFYPANILYMVFPVEPAFRVFMVGHYLLAGIFMWLMLRDLKAGGAASACGALSFTLSGYLLSQNGMPDMLVTSAWLPGCLFFLIRYIRARSRLWFFMFSISLFMPLLAGKAEGVIVLGMAAAGWIIIWDEAGSSIKERVITLAKIMPLAGAIGLILSMVQFLPSFELGRLSMKGEGFGLEIATLWSFHPARLLEFIISSPWGRFWPEMDFRGQSLTGWEGHYPWAISQYMGIPILCGALFALVRASWSKRLLVGAALLAALIFSMGAHSFLYPLVHRLVPPFRIFRYPEKYMVLVVLILSIAGALGISGMIQYLMLERSRRSRSAFGLGAAIVGLAALTLFVLKEFAGNTFFSFGTVSLSPDYFIDQLFHALFVLIALFGIFALAGLRFFRGGAIGMSILLLMALDINISNRWIIPYADPEIYSFEPAALSVIREHSDSHGLGYFNEDGRTQLGRFRVMREPMKSPGAAIGTIEGAYGFERYRRWERHTLLPNFNFNLGIEELTGYTAAPTADFDLIMKSHLTRKTMALFNVRYVIGPGAGDVPELEELPLIGARYSYGFKVLEIPEAFPRAYLIGRSMRVQNAMDDLSYLESHDFQKAVILDDDPGLPSSELESDLGIIPAEVVSYSPEEVRIKVQAPAGSYLVLSDSFYPGWEAFIDGKPTPIFRANYLVRAIWVEAGEHEVVFRHRLVSYLVGRAVSGCGFFLVLVIVAYQALVGIKSPKPQSEHPAGK